MTWTAEHAALAAKQNWGIFTVVDDGKVFEAALPSGGFGKQIPHARAMQQWLLRSAQGGSSLAVVALKHLKAAR